MPKPDQLIEPLELTLPGLPATLAGLRILHLTDTHVRGPRTRQDQLCKEIADCPADLVCFTGDAMCRRGDEPPAIEALHNWLNKTSPRYGVFGVFGNHDTSDLIDAAAGLPIRWLLNDAATVDGLPLQVMGLPNARSAPADAALLALRAAGGWREILRAGGGAGGGGFRLLLTHYPSMLAQAGDLGIDLMLAGHTHGGQVRLPGGRALFNASPLPLEQSSGILRFGRTTAVVSRGLGESNLHLRFCCPPHALLLTLQPGAEVNAAGPTFEMVQSF